MLASADDMIEAVMAPKPKKDTHWKKTTNDVKIVSRIFLSEYYFK